MQDLYFLITKDGKSSIETLQQRLDKDLANSIHFLAYDEMHRHGDYHPGTYIFGNFTLLSGAQRELAIQLAQELEKSPGVHQVFNHPLRALSRFDLLAALHEKGINEFQAHRLTSAMKRDVRFPVFLRHEHDHAANLTELLHSRSELTSAAKKLTRWGRYDPSHLIAVEFCDTSDETGLFRKYSAFRLGDAILPRCLNFSGKWLVKHNLPGYRYENSLEPHSERIEEEVEYMKTNPHVDWLRKVFEMAHIEYGRIDYALLRGRPQVWEINTFPKMGGGAKRKKSSAAKERLRESRTFTRTHFYDQLGAAVEAFTRPQSSPEGRPVHLIVNDYRGLEKERKSERKLETFRDFIASIGIDVKSPRLRKVRSFLGPFFRKT